MEHQATDKVSKVAGKVGKVSRKGAHIGQEQRIEQALESLVSNHPQQPLNVLVKRTYRIPRGEITGIAAPKHFKIDV